MFFTYILESPKGDWYYGHCADLEDRVYRHNSNQNKSTRKKGPWRLIFRRSFASKLEANQFERYLKKLKKQEIHSIKVCRVFPIARCTVGFRSSNPAAPT